MYIRISGYVSQHPPILTNLPDKELEGIIEGVVYCKTNVSPKAREKILYDEKMDGLEEECSGILSDRKKRRAKMKTLVGKSSQ